MFLIFKNKGLFFSILFSFFVTTHAMEDPSVNEATKDLSELTIKTTEKVEEEHRLVPFVRTYFSPDINNAFIKIIHDEQNGIDGAFYRLTHYHVAQHLVAQKEKKGLALEFVVDKDYEKDYCQGLKLLVQNDVPVSYPKRRHSYSAGYEVMHHKFAIFKRNQNNQKLLWTGSFNVTGAANRNNWENVTVISDPGTIDRFEEEFGRLKKSCTKIKERDCVSTKRASSFSKKMNGIPPHHLKDL